MEGPQSQYITEQATSIERDKNKAQWNPGMIGRWTAVWQTNLFPSDLMTRAAAWRRCETPDAVNRFQNGRGVSLAATSLRARVERANGEFQALHQRRRLHRRRIVLPDTMTSRPEWISAIQNRTDCCIRCRKTWFQLWQWRAAHKVTRIFGGHPLR